MTEKARKMDENSPETKSNDQVGQDLFKATMPFGVESVKTSWWLVGSTFVMLIAALWRFGGFDVAFFVVLLPMTIASMIGSYLFFARHSFENMRVLPNA